MISKDKFYFFPKDMSLVISLDALYHGIRAYDHQYEVLRAHTRNHVGDS